MSIFSSKPALTHYEIRRARLDRIATAALQALLMRYGLKEVKPGDIARAAVEKARQLIDAMDVPSGD